MGKTTSFLKTRLATENRHSNYSKSATKARVISKSHTQDSLLEPSLATEWWHLQQKLEKQPKCPSNMAPFSEGNPCDLGTRHASGSPLMRSHHHCCSVQIYHLSHRCWFYPSAALFLLTRRRHRHAMPQGLLHHQIGSLLSSKSSPWRNVIWASGTARLKKDCIW